MNREGCIIIVLRVWGRQFLKIKVIFNCLRNNLMIITKYSIKLFALPVTKIILLYFD